MAAVHQGWLSAASCYATARTHSGLSDLPPEYRREVLRFAGMALASTTSFLIAALMIAAPLPSRAFTQLAPLPMAVRGPVFVASGTQAALARRMAPVDRVGRPSRIRSVSSRAAATVVTAASIEPTAKRSSVFGRFFRGAVRKLRLGSDPNRVSTD